jgi:hypothetical protein
VDVADGVGEAGDRHDTGSGMELFGAA